MYTTLRRMLTLSFAILVAGLPLHLAVGQEAPLPMLSAEIVSIQGAARTYQVVGQGGKVVQFTVPSTSASDIRFSQTMGDSAMVDVTVQSINRRTNLVTVASDLGQTVVLRMGPMEVDKLKINDRFTLVVPRTPAS